MAIVVLPVAAACFRETIVFALDGLIPSLMARAALQVDVSRSKARADACSRAEPAAASKVAVILFIAALTRNRVVIIADH